MSKSSYSLILFHETPRAYLVGREPSDRDDENAFWLPKSQVAVSQTVQKDGIEWGDFEIPDWLADERGLDPSLDGSLIE